MTAKKILYSISFLFFILFPVVKGQEIHYSTGTWDGDVLGNHRVVVEVSEKSDAVWAHIPWRRKDLNPEKKNIIIFDAKAGNRVINVCRVDINREYGDLIFQPAAGPGEYYVYYMPYKLTGSRNYPDAAVYQEPEQTAEVSWLEKHNLILGEFSSLKKDSFIEAKVAEIQSIDEFNSFYPMEVIATAEEIQSLLARYPESTYLLFPEDRKYPIRMADDLPLKWIQSGAQSVFRGDAAKGEFYAFQIGVYACRKAIQDIVLSFSELKSPTGETIAASALKCINLGGVNWDGEPFKKICVVDRGKVQPLWCGIQVPVNIASGKFEGTMNIKPLGLEESQIKLELTIKDEILKDAGDSELWRQSRLRWLDSKIAFNDDLVLPFTPLSIKGNTVNCLGRSLTIGKSGLPERIQSFFAPEVTQILNKGQDILSLPVKLSVINPDGSLFKWRTSGYQVTRKAAGVIAWEAKNESGPLTIDLQARMEFDGFIEFKIKLNASKDTQVEDISLEIPILKDIAKYMMGMGFKGGFRPAEFHWIWDQSKNQDAVWIGDVNAGLQCAFRSENYSRPLNTNFYLSKPLNLPPSWDNDGKGGCLIKETDATTVLIKAFSGMRTIHRGENLHFNFILLLTPFKAIDAKSQWATRFFHAYKPVEEVAKTGANTINIHHANEINPYLNYPFLRPQKMKAYVDEAHRRGFKVKIYYTIRELSNRAAELMALRSLSHEIFSKGPGGGYSWLQEHLTRDYIAAWFVPELKDAAIINSGMSRWHNYYLEGLNWLVKNVGIDGLYIDDLAFDRTTMKRLRKILDRGRRGALIDLHSANQYNVRDGYASSANLYLEHFPFLNRLWFGEYFDYNSSPDYWLIEISGIPFGVMGEMLQDGGNPWRGLIYGMTNRLPWSGKNPAHIWKVWDDFGIQDSLMIGYWSPSCPVKTNYPDVLATAYVKKASVLISIASWAKELVNCELHMDWKTLGLDPQKAQLQAPAVEEFQPEATFKPTDKIPIKPGKGWLLILSEMKSR